MNNLLLSFSGCPNDTFMFDAIVNKRIKNKLKFDIMIKDIEDLNKLTLNEEVDISKVSFANYPAIAGSYQLLTSGSAVGYNNGVLLVSKLKIYPDELEYIKIGIPGKHTTANLLMEILYPKAQKKYEYLFSDIEEAVLDNEVEAGLIIHETRFTYEKRGLKKVSDLGELWQSEMEMPVPLGGIVIKRDLPEKIKTEVSNLIRRSVEFALETPAISEKYIKSYAKELSDSVIRKHIDLYVNDFSVELGSKGKHAIRTLFDKGMKRGLFEIDTQDIFL